MSMVCGEVWTGSEWVRCTELRLWLGMLLLPPGLANHRFCRAKHKFSLHKCHSSCEGDMDCLSFSKVIKQKTLQAISINSIKTWCLTPCTVLFVLIKQLMSPVFSLVFLSEQMFTKMYYDYLGRSSCGSIPPVILNGDTEDKHKTCWKFLRLKFWS